MGHHGHSPERSGPVLECQAVRTLPELPLAWYSRLFRRTHRRRHDLRRRHRRPVCCPVRGPLESSGRQIC